MNPPKETKVREIRDDRKKEEVVTFSWNTESRLAWIEKNLPDEWEKDYGMAAEAAIISIVHDANEHGTDPNLGINVRNVRRWIALVRNTDPNVA